MEETVLETVDSDDKSLKSTKVEGTAEGGWLSRSVRNRLDWTRCRGLASTDDGWMLGQMEGSAHPQPSATQTGQQLRAWRFE